MQLLVFLLSLLFLIGKFRDSEAQKTKRCDVAYKCSSEERPVWTTSNGWSCELFRNECHMRNENCQRLKENKPEAKKITKSKCQALCRSLVCLSVFDPVCGYYNGRRRTFGNDCEMSRYICTTGQTFSLFGKGACPK